MLADGTPAVKELDGEAGPTGPISPMRQHRLAGLRHLGDQNTPILGIGDEQAAVAGPAIGNVGREHVGRTFDKRSEERRVGKECRL